MVATSQPVCLCKSPTGYAQVLEEYEANSSGQTLKKSYVIGLDVEAQWDSTNGLLYLLADGHGSTRLLTDENGALVAGQIFDYDAYGQLLDDTVDPLTTHLYAGEQLDKVTGAYYLRARYYDPATGRTAGWAGGRRQSSRRGAGDKRRDLVFLRVRLRLTLRNTRRRHWPDSHSGWYRTWGQVTTVWRSMPSSLAIRRFDKPRW